MTVENSFKKNDCIFHTGPWFLSFCVLVDVSKYLDILTSEFWTVMVSFPLSASAACHSYPGHFSQCHLRVPLCCCIFETVSSTPNTWDPSKTQKSAFLPWFLASSITSFLFLTFVSCHARIYSNFPNLFPLQPSHPVFFNACQHRCDVGGSWTLVKMWLQV